RAASAASRARKATLNSYYYSMDYRTALVNRINDYDSWPGFDRPDFLNELDTIAEKAFAKDTLEGLLASVLIYHQLCEELVRVLIDCSDFLIQLSVYPAAISFKHFKRRMFGQLLNELEAGIDFPERQLFIQHCTEVNAIRIHLVH